MQIVRVISSSSGSEPSDSVGWFVRTTRTTPGYAPEST